MSVAFVVATLTTALSVFAFCVSMHQHARLIFSSLPDYTQMILLRSGGSLGLMISCYLFVVNLGYAIGLSYFFGMLSVSSLAITFIVTWLNSRDLDSQIENRATIKSDRATITL